MKTKTILDRTIIFCWAVLVFFMVTIAVRFLTRQILVEKWGWDNAFTELVFWGDEQMNVDDGENAEETIDIDWAARYPFREKEKETAAEPTNPLFSYMNTYQTLVNAVEDKITAYAEDMLFGHYQMTTAAKRYNVAIGSPAMTSEDEVIVLNNGYLTYEQELVEETDIAEMADSVAGFSAFLKGEGIGFLYANAGSKVCPYDKELPMGAVEHTNENGDRLAEALEERGVAVLDYRRCMEQDGLDWYASYYITDHHWKDSTGLWAAGVLADELNAHYGFSFDRKYFEPESYAIEVHGDYFLGGQGRAVTFAAADLEPFEEILPKFDTEFSVRIPTKAVDKTGDYGHTLFDEDAFAAIADYDEKDFLEERDAYGCVEWRNDALGTVQNHLTADNQGKKILMLQDSFGWYLSTYLATDVPGLDLMNVSVFDGSVRSYIEKTQPDMVIMLLCERNIRPIDWSGHRDYFDLR